MRIVDEKSQLEKFDSYDVNEFKRTRNFDRILWGIFKEGLIFFAFSSVLFTIAYLNISKSYFQYNKLFINTFLTSSGTNEIGFFDVSLLFKAFYSCFLMIYSYTKILTNKNILREKFFSRIYR